MTIDEELDEFLLENADGVAAEEIKRLRAEVGQLHDQLVASVELNQIREQQLADEIAEVGRLRDGLRHIIAAASVPLANTGSATLMTERLMQCRELAIRTHGPDWDEEPT